MVRSWSATREAFCFGRPGACGRRWEGLCSAPFRVSRFLSNRPAETRLCRIRGETFQLGKEAPIPGALSSEAGPAAHLWRRVRKTSRWASNTLFSRSRTRSLSCRFSSGLGSRWPQGGENRGAKFTLRMILRALNSLPPDKVIEVSTGALRRR